MRIFYKDLNTEKTISAFWPLGKPIENFLNIVGNVEYVLVDDTNTDYDTLQECLKIENGVLAYDLALLKETVDQRRKTKYQALFKPYDKVFEDIYAKRIPESELGNTYATLETSAEYKRTLIRQQSADCKSAINIATRASTVLAIWQELEDNE